MCTGPTSRSGAPVSRRKSDEAWGPSAEKEILELQAKACPAATPERRASAAAPPGGREETFHESRAPAARDHGSRPDDMGKHAAPATASAMSSHLRHLDPATSVERTTRPTPRWTGALRSCWPTPPPASTPEAD